MQSFLKNAREFRSHNTSSCRSLNIIQFSGILISIVSADQCSHGNVRFVNGTTWRFWCCRLISASIPSEGRVEFCDGSNMEYGFNGADGWGSNDGCCTMLYVEN